MRLLLVGLCLLLSCSRPLRPDVLLITVDTLRADRLGCYGYGSQITPNLDRLAAEGVLYEQCQSPIPVTLPSHASIMTGKLPNRHGVRNNATYRLPDEIPTLAEQLRAAGYQTGAFVAALPLDQRFGLGRGFDHYDDSVSGEQLLFGLPERSASEVLRSALSWLRDRDGDRPVFVWVHLFEPHFPYLPPPPFDERFPGRAYDGEVAAADAAVGRLVEAMDAARARPRITVVTSDHGEGLGEHGEATHAIHLYQSTLHVPLIFHAPDRWPAGARVAEVVGLIDVAPTLLHALGLDPAVLAPDGIALEPAGETPTRRPHYSESLYALEAYRWAPLFALREGPRKVIRSRISRSYDLVDDPGETNDLGAEGTPWSATLLSQLDRRIVAAEARTGELDASRQTTPEEIEALAALGYVGGVPEPSGPRDDDRLLRLTTELPDATERLEEFETTREAEASIAVKDYDQAVDMLERLLETNPQNAWARMLHGQALGESGRVEEAIAAYETALALRPDWLETELNLARLYGRAGEVAKASLHFANALAIEPQDIRLRIEAAAFMQSNGRLEQGLLLLETGLRSESDPGERARLQAALARLLYQKGDLERGAELLAQARARVDDDGLRTLAALYLRAQGRRGEIIDLLAPHETDCGAEALVYLGEALQVAGRPEEAAARYRHALERDSALHLAHNNLAWALAVDLGQPSAALAHAERAIALLPESPDYQDTYLEVLLRLHRDEDARRHLREILPRFPESPALAARAEALL